MTEQILVPLKDIKPNPYQPRAVEDTAAIAEIAINIYRNGLMQIPSARPVNGHYELVFGHTRKAAYELLATTGVPSAEIAPDARFAKMPLNIHTLDDRQMFEMAVAENIKRRDLNSIEQAQAMKRYMDEFNANSKQAAELFGVNDATVRGKVRLLELPEQAQAKLAAGAISEGTARALLSMQKIATEKQIEDTLKSIEKNDDGELPDVIIERAVDDLDNVVEMWRDSRDGKPRGDWRNSWLLDMKNFPNKMLPELTVEDYAEVFNLEDEISGKNKRVWNCINKASSAANLVAIWQTSDFEDDHPRAEKLAHLINPPACNICPFYTKVRGSHYCGMKVCHERKTIAWHAEMIRAASKDLGIEIYQEADGNYVVLENYKPGHKPMFEKRHKDLRLMPKEQITGHGYFSQYGFDGVKDEVFMVVATGDSVIKLREKSSTSLKGTVDRAAQRKAKMFRTKRKELIWEFCLGVKSMFDMLGSNVLEELNNWKYIGVDDRPLEDEDGEDKKAEGMDDVDHQRCMLVWRLVNEQTNLYERDKQTKVVQVAKHLEGLAKKWNVKAPKDLMKKAEYMDNDIESVAAETPKKKK